MEFTLSAIDRKALKARAHSLHPILQLGEKGLTDAVIAEIDRALAAHELIKVRAVPLNRDEREVALASICERTSAHAIQHIGKMLIVYRRKPQQKPPQSKPQHRSTRARSEWSGFRTSPRRSGPARRPRRTSPLRPTKARKIKFGVLKGKIRYPDNLDALLPRRVLAQFEGRDTQRGASDLTPTTRTASPRQEYSRPRRRRPPSRSTPLRSARRSRSSRPG